MGDVSYPAMCRDGHAEVRYGYDAEGLALRNRETCPVCTLRDALREISKGQGPYSRDPLTHAGNCIEDMRGIALAALSMEVPRV